MTQCIFDNAHEPHSPDLPTFGAPNTLKVISPVSLDMTKQP